MFGVGMMELANILLGKFLVLVLSGRNLGSFSN